MTDTFPNSLTIEEAVARLINLDYIPEDFTLQEFLMAFVEEAEVDLENAKARCLPEHEISVYQTRLTACEARVTLANKLKEDIEYFIRENAETEYGDQLVCTEESTGRIRIDTHNLKFWAASRYGINFIDIADESRLSNPNADIDWRDVTIYLRQDCCIGYKIGNGKEYKKKAYEVGFGHKKRKHFNSLGVILLGLSRDEIYPPVRHSVVESKYKKAISDLRSKLKILTGINGDPFERYDPERGWRQKFKIKDRTNVSNERAEAEARYTQHNDRICAGGDRSIEDDCYGEEDFT